MIRTFVKYLTKNGRRRFGEAINKRMLPVLTKKKINLAWVGVCRSVKEVDFWTIRSRIQGVVFFFFSPEPFL